MRTVDDLRPNGCRARSAAPAPSVSPAALPPSGRSALILVSHQSLIRRPNSMLRILCRRLKQRRAFDVVWSVNIAAPNGLESKLERLKVMGVVRVIIFPYFLHDGFHVGIELPKRLRALRRRYPAIQIRQCPHLGSHPALVSVVADLTLV